MRQELLQIARALTSSVTTNWVEGLPVLVSNDAHHSAMQDLFLMALERPIDALAVICQVAKNSQDEDTLDDLTSGPLETLLKHSGDVLNHLIGRYASDSLTFKSMVEGATR